jgi:hypothetical protein
LEPLVDTDCEDARHQPQADLPTNRIAQAGRVRGQRIERPQECIQINRRKRGARLLDGMQEFNK